MNNLDCIAIFPFSVLFTIYLNIAFTVVLNSVTCQLKKL